MNYLRDLSAISVQIDSLNHLRQELDRLDGWLFRGQHKASLDIESSVQRAARRCGIETGYYEEHCFEEFRRRAHSYFSFLPPLDSTAEWLGWMQHYGAPTRIIDFSRSPWVAAFFAIEWLDKKNPTDEVDVAVWAIKRSSVERPLPDKRDRNALLGHLVNPSRFKTKHAGHCEPTVDDNKRIERMEPFLIHDRLSLQKGEFLFAFDLSRPFLEMLTEQLDVLENGVRKFIIPHRLRNDILRVLADMNCDAGTLFPGPDGLGRTLQNQLPSKAS